MINRFSFLSLVLVASLITACTSTKPLSTKKYPKAIIGKWHVIELNVTGMRKVPLDEQKPFLEYTSDGKFTSTLGSNEQTGTYELKGSKLIITVDGKLDECDISFLSKTHFNFSLGDVAQRASFFTSKYPVSNNKSVFKKE